MPARDGRGARGGTRARSGNTARSATRRRNTRRRGHFALRRAAAILTVLLAAAVTVAVVVAAVHRLDRHPPAPVVPRLAPTVNVTIIPGHSRQQVQKLLHESGIRGNYVRPTVRSPLLNPTRYGAPANTPSLEGFLWPDTYNLRKPVRIKALITDQLTTFKQNFALVKLRYAESKNLTPYDVLKIASLLTGEAMRPSDARKVASVIYNRLRLGMELGLDSTVEYATGNYGTLTAKDLQSRSPWNTRNHTGLPPTPINSPDLAAINAAAHPAHTDYLYFIDRVCGNGALRFTASYQQFLIWSAAWSNAVTEAAKHHRSAEFCKKGKP